MMIISCAHPDMPQKNGPNKGSIFPSQGLIKSSFFWGGYIEQAMILCCAAATEMLKTNTPPKKKRGKIAKGPWKPQITSSVPKNATNKVLTPTTRKIGDSKHVLVLPICKKRHLQMKPIFNQSFRGSMSSAYYVKDLLGMCLQPCKKKQCSFPFLATKDLY